MTQLIVCRSCQRHVKPQEPQCPFCGGGRGTEPGSNTRRAAAFILGVGLCMGACSSSDSGGDSNAYGPPPFGGNGGADAADGSGGTSGSGGAAGAPADAGTDAADGATD